MSDDVHPGSRPLVSAVAYMLAAALQRGVTFVLLAFATKIFSPAEYGRLSILLAIFGALAILLAAGLDYGLFRQYFQLEGDPDAQERLIHSTWRMLLWTSFGCAGIATPLLVALGELGVLTHPAEAVAAIVAAAALVSATTVPMVLLRAEQRLKEYVALSATSAVGMAAFTMLFVVWLRWGILGWLLAVVVANLGVLLMAVRLIPWRGDARYHRSSVSPAMRAGLPLVPHFLSHWSLQLADRLVLAGLVTGSALGIYSLAANIALPAMIVISSINQGFMPSYARAARTDGVGLDRVATTHIALVCLVGCGAALLGTSVVASVAPASYADATELEPWIVLGYCFLGIYYIPMNVVSLTAGRTNMIWVFTAVSATTNLILIWLLVPHYGLLSAAIASALGYLVLLLLISIYVACIGVQVSIEWLRVLAVVGVGAGTYLAASRWTSDSGVASIIVRVCVLLVPLTALGYVAGAFDRDTRPWPFPRPVDEA